jgi:hypothetical protein
MGLLLLGLPARMCHLSGETYPGATTPPAIVRLL